VNDEPTATLTRARDQLTLFHMPCIEPLSATWHRNCQDCDADTLETGEYYLVHDEVWPIDSQGGVLCIGCLEDRIGRRLVAADFTDCLLNREWRGHSERLAARLGEDGDYAGAGAIGLDGGDGL
jgi:hypothetical protein